MRTIRWGLIGCGDIAIKRVAPAMRDLEGHSIRAIAEGRQPRVTGRTGRETSRIMEAAYRSNREGLTCRIETDG